MNILNPLYLLLLIPVVLLLIYAYLNRGQGRKIYVASLFLLQKLQKKSSLRSKLTFPPRFFYDLFLVFLLITTLAGFYIKQSKQSISVLVDNSFSTTAKINEISVFEQNKADLLAELQREGADDNYQLCWTSPIFECLGRDLLSYQNFLVELNKIQPVRSTDKISSAIRQLAISDLAIIVTDQTPRKFEPNYKVINSKARSLNNIAISGVSYRDNKYRVQVENYSNNPVENYIFLDFLKFDNSNQSKEWKTAGRRKIKLSVKAGSLASIGFDFPESNSMEYDFALISINSEIDHSLNAVSGDDYFWVANKNSSRLRKGKIYLITERSKSDLGLDSLINVPHEILAIKEYENSIKNKSFDSDSKLIFDSYLPPVIPPHDSIFLAANAKNGFVKLNFQKESAITNWKSDSDFLKYLNVGDLLFSKTWTSNLPVWFEQIIGINDQSLLAKGQKNNHHYSYVGFPVLPYVGAKTPELSTLALNVFNNFVSKASLAREGEEDFVVNSKLLANSSGVTISGLNNTEFNSLDLAKDPLNAKVNNFFIENESDLRRTNSFDLIEASSSKKQTSKNRSSNKSLVKLFIIGFLLALFIWRKKTTKSSQIISKEGLDAD